MDVNTNSYTLFDAGHYTMAVSDIPSEENINGTVFWRFTFKTSTGEDYEEFLPVWLCGPLFKALGFPETKPGHYDVDPPAALNKVIDVDVVHETIEKGKKAGTVVSRLKNMVERKQSKLPDDDKIPF